MPSRLLPPWFDTEIAEQPASSARLASSTRMTPLSMNGPPHCSRSQATSSHVGSGVPIHWPYAPKNVGGCWPGAARFGVVRSGTLPVFANSHSHFGRVMPSGANWNIALRSIFSGIDGLPQSRPLENDQSSVMIRPVAPAARARSMRWSSVSRSPTQYIWKKVCGLAAATSSMDLLAKELRPIAVPRAAAARATATSPSGCTACTPVGEIITGIEMGWPITVVDRSRSPDSPATCGAKPSSEKAAMLSSTVSPFSEPATSAAYTDLGRRFFARRCASATVSNHVFLAIEKPLVLLVNYFYSIPASGFSSQIFAGGRVSRVSGTGACGVRRSARLPVREWSWLDFGTVRSASSADVP